MKSPLFLSAFALLLVSCVGTKQFTVNTAPSGRELAP